MSTDTNPSLFEAKTNTLLWPLPAQEGIFLERRKRFFGDFVLSNSNGSGSGNESEVSAPRVAHVANTGSLRGVLRTGQPCLVLPSNDPTRKLQWTLVALGCKPLSSSPSSASSAASSSASQSLSDKALIARVTGHPEATHPNEWVGVHTPVPNQLVAELMRTRQLIPDLKAYKKEHKLNAQTRLDGLALTESYQEIFVEVKNVTLANPNPLPTAEFPDSVTERGQKHLIEMTSLLKSGKKTLLIFVVQRSDCERFSPAATLDPSYAKLFNEYLAAGGEALALSCRVSPRGVQYLKTIPVFQS